MSLYEEPFCTDFNILLFKLTELGICLPDSMVESIIYDQENNIGNKFVKYEMNGTFVAS